MCLAIPGKIVAAEEHEGMRTGKVQFGGITREVSLDFLPEANVGDFVIVHVGYAISIVDPEEAEKSFEILQSMGMLADELESDLEKS